MRGTDTVHCGLLSIILIAFCFMPARATECADPIDTNRPTFAFSPVVVPRGSVQVESGTVFQGFQGHAFAYNIPETQVRLGILKTSEFQISVPSYYLLHANGESTGYASGLSDLGLKIHLGKGSDNYINPRYNVSFIASLNVPTGSATISGSGVEPVFRLPWGVSLRKGWFLLGMQSLGVLNGGRDVQYTPDFVLARAFGTKAGAFVEYESVITHGSYPLNIIHMGGIWRLTKNQQVDCHFGFGLNRAAPTAFVGVGYSFRVCLRHR